jgi:hypothetical protein
MSKNEPDLAAANIEEFCGASPSWSWQLGTLDRRRTVAFRRLNRGISAWRTVALAASRLV